MSKIVEPTWSPRFQSLSSRMWILASFYTAIVLAIPFWLKATSIQRLPLPRHEVVAWEAQLPCPIRMHHSITLLVPSEVIKPADRFAVADRIQWSLRAAGDGIKEQRPPKRHYVDQEAEEGKVEVAKAETGTEEEGESLRPLQYAACVDWDVRVADQDEHRSVTGLHYEIEFLSDDTEASEIYSTPTRRRIQVPLPAKLRPNHELGSEETSFILSSYLAKLFQLPYTPLLSPSDSPSSASGVQAIATSGSSRLLAEIERKEEDRRRVPYTRNLRLVFSLINEEISASHGGATIDRRQTSGVKGWNRWEVDSLFKKRFSPLLTSLGATQNVHTELQTTWFAPLQFQPKLLEVERGEEAVEQQSEVSIQAEKDEEMAEEAKEEEEVEGLKDLETQATSPPVKKIDQYHVIDWEDIKIFVNSGEWSLTSGAVTLPLSSVNSSSADSEAEREMMNLFEQSERTLHFILYIPKPSHRPLRIAGNEQATVFSDAKGWLIPQWGGVSLFNLGYEEAESIATSDGISGHVLDHLTAEALDGAFATFEKQFSTLLGLQETQGSSIAGDAALSLRLDAMTRRRMVASSRESVKTLGSIIRLVDKIENLGVGQSVRDDVSKALDLLGKAKQLINGTLFNRTTASPSVVPLTPLQQLLELTHSSELVSSRAFFNPNMLGQLYFPDEHKYAVYTPLFGPLAVPLLVAGLRLLKEKRQTSAQKRAVNKAPKSV